MRIRKQKRNPPAGSVDPSEDFPDILLLNNCQQYEIQNKEDGGHPEDRMNAGGFFLTDLYDTVGDETEGDSVGNTVAQRHEQSGEESRNRFGEVIPFDFLESRSHHDTNYNQRGSSGSGRNRADKGGQECADGKTDGDHYAGQAGASAGADTGSTLHKGGGVGGTEDGTDGSCNGVCEQSFIHF